MIEDLAQLPAHVRRRLAQALEGGVLAEPYAPMSLLATIGAVADLAQVSKALCELAKAGARGAAAAAWLRMFDRATSATKAPDLVWSGPEVPGLHARDTRRVFEELLGMAERSLWISTYAFFDGPRAFELLARRMELLPNLRVTLFLNIRRPRDDKSAADSIVRRFAERFWGFEWPGGVRPRVYFDPRALDLGVPSSVLHAKAVVADDEAVLVTSANMTEAAFDRNIELGVLVRDRALALSMTGHFQVLIEQHRLRALPSA